MNVNRDLKLCYFALAATCIIGWSPAFAGPDSCDNPVHVTDEAERQPGGALYKGPSAPHHNKHGSDVPEMKGAHMDHKARRDGAFFMAPNKMHHLEGKYSEQCGFQLYLFNAFTKPIHVGRFRAFITVIPSSDDEAEIIRFLSPDKKLTYMAGTIGEGVTRPFKIELHLKFPEADDPELFSIHVPALATTSKSPANK
ncbi:MAG: hypothetical protein HOM25_02345 [Rhodospirillaceae bacterium]|jgi:hypothetical protein|nr:hypothetical protein [Rhodospirillaceae bacterium]MBT5664427.1 hypothetical protein [Rhodospirillaceae bacterium]MBT5809148.1 hypothetical protein [Rhodospirillaceae bacterium]